MSDEFGRRGRPANGPILRRINALAVDLNETCDGSGLANCSAQPRDIATDSASARADQPAIPVEDT